MKRTRAQFILLASLLIAIIIFSTYIIYYSMSRSYEQTRRSEINYQLLNTSNDFDRVTLNALANASQTYGITGDMNKSRKNALLILSQWQQLAITVYTAQTIKIDVHRLNFNGISRVLSIINATLAINMTNPVLVGYKYNSVHFLNITSTAPIRSSKDKSWQFNITVISENGPDTTLSKTNIERLEYINKTGGQWINVTGYGITSAGNGVYMISFNVTSKKEEVIAVLLGISDNRGIYAELITYSGTNKFTDSEGSTIEFNMIKFSNSRNVLPAVPSLSIKQISVNATKLRSKDILKETLLQVEQWNNINTRINTITSSSVTSRSTTTSTNMFVLGVSVKWSDGESVAGANVYVYDSHGNQVKSAYVIGSTKFSLPPGEYIVNASLYGVSSGVKVSLFSDTSIILYLNMSRARIPVYEFKLKVVWVDGNPVDNVLIRITKSDGTPIADVITNGNGIAVVNLMGGFIYNYNATSSKYGKSTTGWFPLTDQIVTQSADGYLIYLGDNPLPPYINTLLIIGIIAGYALSALILFGRKIYGIVRKRIIK